MRAGTARSAATRPGSRGWPAVPPGCRIASRQGAGAAGPTAAGGARRRSRPGAPERRWQCAGSRITKPAVPSITAIPPARIWAVSPIAPKTAGIPKARSMIAVCPSAPPSSVATPATRAGSIRAASAGVSHSATNTEPGGKPAKDRERRAGQVAHQTARDLFHSRPPGAARPARRPHSPQARWRRSQQPRPSPPARPTATRPRCAAARPAAAATGPSIWTYASSSGAISACVSSGNTCNRARSFPSCLRDATTAASNRTRSASMSAAAIRCRVMTVGASTVPNTGPIAIPGATGRPVSRRSNRQASAPPSVGFIEPGFDQGLERCQRLYRVGAGGAHLDR